MHIHFEKNDNAKCDCTILSLSWMGKVPDEVPEEEGWKLNRNNYYQEGWLATGNVRGVVGVTFTSSHARRADQPLRTNYNLRGHRSDVILVKWNEPYQKLASCDSSGVIFVWIKYEGRWSIELINDRSTPVTHFSWSHDGRMALICYQDGFVLVGSVAGQRYWSAMLTLEARITCGCWTPDDAQVYLGTASAELVVMDVHGAMVSQVQLVSEGGITSMAWSCEKFKMEEGAEAAEADGHVLAVAFASGDMVMLRGHDDVSPARLRTGFRGDTLAMEWATSRELLAVAGTLAEAAGAAADAPPFNNYVKFYSDSGALIYTVPVPYTQARVSALTWGHCARRLFVACGGRVCAARVWRAVAPLQLLCRVRAAAALRGAAEAARLPLPPKLRPLVASMFSHTVRCNVPEAAALRSFVSLPPAGGARLHCTMLRHDDEDGGYTLYLEHLGGLVPLLKGRRTSKIRPEFVIFDPQAEEGCLSSSERGSSSSSSGGSASPRITLEHLQSDSSDTEREDGCSGSPRLQRRRGRRARERRRVRTTEREAASDELAYIDSLPEDVRLVEVTSNIWGTKFKMHGLAKNVPANLGQVTYKTSLLHLQPRQMTLAITELRPDCPLGPDPSFNPNIFSEDEEEVFQEGAGSPARGPGPEPGAGHGPALARAESYSELPCVDTAEAAERRGAGGRHAVSPLRCEASLPALQSPKNAVAPTDIIFERPSPAVACGGRGDFYGRADYSLRDAGAKPDQFAPTLEPARQYTIKKCESHAAETCLGKLRKNICGREGGVKALCSKGYEHEVHPDAARRADLRRAAEELRFIDEEAAEERPRRPNTVVAISPVRPPDALTRSCSVGYLDLVDPQVLVSVTALRDPPRRLVLVNHKRKKKPKEPKYPKTLRKCGKSRSLDSSEAFAEKARREEGAERPRDPPPRPAPPAPQPDSDYSKYYSSLEQLAVRLLSSRVRRGRTRGEEGGGARCGARGAAAGGESASAPASPRPAPRRSRYPSASPIRQLLNSPLLGRRRNKKSESSDDEAADLGARNYRDLESFQKAQLRLKLKRGGGNGGGPNGGGGAGAGAARRQLVMHNKAPMWNENSQVYQLDFGGRVTQESAKNFQIEHDDKQVMQFGRIDGNAYTLDFQYPFSALQAFAVALANVTQRLK